MGSRGGSQEPSPSCPGAAFALTHPDVSHSPPHTYSIIASGLAPLWEVSLPPNPSQPGPKRRLFQEERAKSCLFAAAQPLHRVLSTGNTLSSAGQHIQGLFLPSQVGNVAPAGTVVFKPQNLSPRAAASSGPAPDTWMEPASPSSPWQRLLREPSPSSEDSFSLNPSPGRAQHLQNPGERGRRMLSLLPLKSLHISNKSSEDNWLLFNNEISCQISVLLP